MTKDFSKYQAIIDEFSGTVTADDFESRYSEATSKLSKTDRFLLKMEIKRLAAPCTRLIDLRGHVDGECRPFEHEDRVHYLDDIAIKCFEETFNQYNGYTFGVYEAVMNTENNFRVMYQREKDQLLDSAPSNTVTPKARVLEKTQYPAELFTFGPYYNRKEERMNFAIPLTVELNGNKIVEVTSSDISINGCKFRYKGEESFTIRQMVSLRFTGLEGEFQFGKNDEFNYQVRNVHIVDNVQLVGLERISTTEPRRDGIRQFISGFIQGNKRRYKINLDNTIAALQSRSIEQFILPKSNELPIFIEDNEQGVHPRYVLTCHNNQNVFQYWQDENRQSTLNFLVTPERLLRIKKYASQYKPLLVYSFIHTSNGKSYFYTADTIQLEDDLAFKKQFLGFAANKASFAVHQLYALSLDESRAYSPLTLADTITKRDQHLNQPIAEDVLVSLSNLASIVIAYRVESEAMSVFYQQLDFENINTNKLKNFGHKRLLEPLAIDDVGINYNNQRQEPRFKYKTPVAIAADGVKWHGVSEDFSTSGLKVELEKASVLIRGNVINVTFPQLQKITSSFNLNELPYEVMRVSKDKTVLHLRVYVEQHQHIGRSFFKALIEKNRHKLTPDEYAMFSPGLAKALRNIYSQSLQTIAFLVQSSGSRYKYETIATNDTDNPFLTRCKQLSDRNNYFNLYPVLNHANVTSVLTASLKKMQSDDPSISETLYISINPSSEIVEQAVNTKLESELQSDMIKKMFIKNALKRGEFYCIQLKLSRTDKPDMKYLNPELSYISTYAMHRGKQIEQEIFSVAGVVQLFDVTQEALARYKLQMEEIPA
ncbi:PilZ domain-containing protein [Thalassotalea sediminis]|uniref:PilZ domain-containing protein n=1 Tax=Thalassotalea sediminis TaxID=1759089 RepID=UPI002572839B|nr:PilZ domain-containing protein [Thalassotalea sediminis]